SVVGELQGRHADRAFASGARGPRVREWRPPYCACLLGPRTGGSRGTPPCVRPAFSGAVEPSPSRRDTEILAAVGTGSRLWRTARNPIQRRATDPKRGQKLILSPFAPRPSP